MTLRVDYPFDYSVTAYTIDWASVQVPVVALLNRFGFVPVLTDPQPRR